MQQKKVKGGLFLISGAVANRLETHVKRQESGTFEVLSAFESLVVFSTNVLSSALDVLGGTCVSETEATKKCFLVTPLLFKGHMHLNKHI